MTYIADIVFYALHIFNQDYILKGHYSLVSLALDFSVKSMRRGQ